MNVLSGKKDKWIPWCFVFFFAGLFIIDGIMVTLAIRTQTGTVTDHAYEKGLYYNRIVKAADRQASLEWRGNIQFQNNTLIFSLSDKAGKTLIPTKATAFFFRPSSSGMDFDVSLKQEDSIMQEKIHFPAAGLWEVRIYVKADGHTYQQSKRIVVP